MIDDAGGTSDETTGRATAGAAPGPSPDSRHLPALDGLRGFALSIAVWTHLRPEQMPGGAMALSLFFPLSGFLITRVMLADLDRRGRVSLSTFWRRRAWRLLPAHYASLCVIVGVLLLDGSWSADRARDVVSSALYVNNWSQLGRATDYWAEFGGAPLTHLWSLSVEEQFYVGWPLLFVALTAASGVRRRPMVLAALTGLGALAAAAYGIVVGRDADPTRVYYDSFVRASELLVGCATALLMRARPALSTSRRAGTTSGVLAVAALAVIGVTVLGVDVVAAGWITTGGLFAAGLVTCAVLVAAHHRTAATRALELRPLQWVGTRCYSIYLWHLPVISLVDERATGISGWALTAVQLVTIVAVSVLSYHLVEERWRRGRRPRAASESTQATAPTAESTTRLGSAVLRNRWVP